MVDGRQASSAQSSDPGSLALFFEDRAVHRETAQLPQKPAFTFDLDISTISSIRAEHDILPNILSINQ